MVVQPLSDVGAADVHELSCEEYGVSSRCCVFGCRGVRCCGRGCTSGVDDDGVVADDVFVTVPFLEAVPVVFADDE